MCFFRKKSTNALHQTMLATIKETVARSQLKILKEHPDQVAGHAKLKKIPLLRYLDALSLEDIGLKQFFLIQKMGCFLDEIQAVKAKVREAFVKKVQAGRFGETLAYSLQHLDRVEKASLLGKLVVALMEEEIEEDDFWRYAHLIQALSYEDLVAIEALCLDDQYDPFDHLAYVQAGILVVDPKVVYEQEVSRNLGIEQRYHLSHRGTMMQQLLFGKKVAEPEKVEKPAKPEKRTKRKEPVPPVEEVIKPEEPSIPAEQESPKAEE